MTSDIKRYSLVHFINLKLFETLIFFYVWWLIYIIAGRNLPRRETQEQRLPRAFLSSNCTVFYTAQLKITFLMHFVHHFNRLATRFQTNELIATALIQPSMLIRERSRMFFLFFVAPHRLFFVFLERSDALLFISNTFSCAILLVFLVEMREQNCRPVLRCARMLYSSAVAPVVTILMILCNMDYRLKMLAFIFLQSQEQEIDSLGFACLLLSCS